MIFTERERNGYQLHMINTKQICNCALLYFIQFHGSNYNIVNAQTVNNGRACVVSVSINSQDVYIACSARDSGGIYSSMN